ncbi:MAG: hypothetical protein K2V38_20115 [Gemmataceae bacterium]|nr:hypothetical protein [Gemmataceae bacterium]
MSAGLHSADLLREIYYHPKEFPAFRPEWRTSDVAHLAAAIYNSRDFSAMPILADALQDAGCDNPHALRHCRAEDAGAHVRGCWVLDLALDRR